MILKEVPGIPGLEISPDGNVVYYKGKSKNAFHITTVRGNKKYRRLFIRIDGVDKKYSMAKLVFETYIGKFPPCRKITFLDGNTLNVSYKNLGPKPMLFNLNLKKITGFDELYINRNGTLIVQHGYIVTCGFYAGLDDEKGRYLGCCIATSRGIQKVYIHQLVVMAYKYLPLGARIVHLDSNRQNNDINNLQVYTHKEYSKRFTKHLEEHRKANAIKRIAIPQADIEKVKKRLLNGDTLQNIAEDYGCSDMAVVRFKKRHFTKAQIDQINKNNGINTTHTDKEIVKQVIEDLKAGVQQIKLVKKYNLSPTIICRINRIYIRENKELK